MNVKDSPLYKSLCKSVRKQDHAELLRMLEMVPIETWSHENVTNLTCAFTFHNTVQGHEYWWELTDRLKSAGFPY